MADPISITPGVLLETLARRIERISEDQHRLAAERSALEDQVRRLRIGVTTPEAVLLALQTRGVRLRGITLRPSAERQRVAG